MNFKQVRCCDPKLEMARIFLIHNLSKGLLVRTRDHTYLLLYLLSQLKRVVD